MLSFEAAAAALVDCLCREARKEAAWPPAHPRHFDGAARYVIETQARMPDYLRLPLRILTLVFDAWALPWHCRPFHRLTHERRLAQVRVWQASRLEARRRLVEFYATLGVFGLYSELYGPDQGEDSEHAG